MGRFDALTLLEDKDQDKKAKRPKPPIISESATDSLSANQQTSETVNGQISKSVNQLADRSANQLISKSANPQTDFPTNQQINKQALSTKQKLKFGTYLRPESITDIHILAATANKKAHEIFQDIVDYFFDHHKK